LAPKAAGSLEEIYVHEGDVISADTVVARVGNALIKSDVSGTVISVNNAIGTIFNPGQAVVSMVQNDQLRVVGQLAEDKGLKDVKIGQTATFTVDAFGSKKYYGVVDEISSTSRDSGVAFNISDKREAKIFNIKIRFDGSAYSELKNGMSAKIWIDRN
jgi:multidrug resistance efflux pump